MSLVDTLIEVVGTVSIDLHPMIAPHNYYSIMTTACPHDDIMCLIILKNTLTIHAHANTYTVGSCETNKMQEHMLYHVFRVNSEAYHISNLM